MNTEIEKVNGGQLAEIRQIPAANMDAGQILAIAIQAGRSADDLEKLAALYERMEAKRAQREFSAAVAKFRQECPPVARRTDSQFDVSVNGVKRKRKYADLDDIQTVVDPVLSGNGLSYRWGNAVVKEGLLTQDCILSHIGGHSEPAAVSIPVDSNAGSSPAQKYMSASTYARRYSLIAVLGIRGCDEDDDGAGTMNEPTETITEAQARTLNDLMIARYEGETPEVAAKRKANFLKAMGVDCLTNIPAEKFESASEALKKKASK